MMITQILAAELTLWRVTLERWQWLAIIGVGLAIAVVPPLVVVLAIGALVVGAAIITQPLVGVLLALLLGPLKAWEEVFAPAPIAAITTGQLVLMFAIVCWIARGLAHGRFNIPRTGLNVPIWIFLLMSSVTVWNAVSVFEGIKEIVKWLEVLLIIWMILDLTAAWPRRRVVLALTTALLGMGLIQALLGVFQFAVRGAGPAHFIIFGRFYRATGTFQQPNPFGGYIALNLLLALGALVGVVFWLWERKQKEGRSWRDLIVGRPWLLLPPLVTGMMGLALIGSWSRGAWLNVASGALILVLFLPRNRWRGIGLALAAALLLGVALALDLVPAVLQERLFGFLSTFQFRDVSQIELTPDNYAIVERLAHWQAAINMARESLWFGVGFGNYEPVYDLYRLDAWPDALGHAHNIYLNTLAEMGVWGLVAYAIFWLPIYWQAGRLTNRLAWPERGLALGILAGLSGMAVHNLLDNLFVNNNYIYLGVLFGLLVVLQSRDVESANSTIAAAPSEVTG